MPVSKQDALNAILAAIQERASQAQDSGDGHVDEDTQHDVDALVALTEEPALTELVNHLNGQGGGKQPASLSLDRPNRREPTLVDTLVNRGASAAKPVLESLLKRARRIAGKKFPPRS